MQMGELLLKLTVLIGAKLPCPIHSRSVRMGGIPQMQRALFIRSVTVGKK
jgi:hypothetical protein